MIHLQKNRKKCFLLLLSGVEISRIRTRQIFKSLIIIPRFAPKVYKVREILRGHHNSFVEKGALFSHQVLPPGLVEANDFVGRIFRFVADTRARSRYQNYVDGNNQRDEYHRTRGTQFFALETNCAATSIVASGIWIRHSVDIRFVVSGIRPSIVWQKKKKKKSSFQLENCWNTSGEVHRAIKTRLEVLNYFIARVSFFFFFFNSVQRGRV